MKNSRSTGRGFRALLLGALVACALAPVAGAQDKKAPAEVQKDYDQFIAKFRSALKANDRAAVTGMTKLPFHANPEWDAAHFSKNFYAKLFPPKVRTCIQRAKGVYDRAPNGEENFSVFCGEDMFIFTRTPNGFLFTEAGVND